ncbi:uncharacterized protein K02A2.6-like [Uranotaenia lowii]|uniref:uncharacterized protein K02A2.6-like n=1 Tax=Uranotaenia lowii TaxID=190385 RepID=UPI00247ADC8C|nr:uncharacterized protein K02A2.6-like [Uranotaenia lowii]
MVKVMIEGLKLFMEIDTGSAATVISKDVYLKNFKYLSITRSHKKLIVVNGEKLSIFGEISVEATLNNLTYKGKLIILDCGINFTPLLGRDWLEMFYPDWRNNFMAVESVRTLKSDISLEQTISYKADLTFKSNQPIFKRAYEVPFKIRDKFVAHLDMLESQGVISPIKASEWASPVIAVLKKDNDIRMVIDCKVAIGSHVLKAHKHQLKLAPEHLGRSKVFITRNETAKRRRDSVDLEEEFRGFPDGPLTLDVGAPTLDRRFLSVRSPIVTRSRKNRLID